MNSGCNTGSTVANFIFPLVNISLIKKSQYWKRFASVSNVTKLKISSLLTIYFPVLKLAFRLCLLLALIFWYPKLRMKVEILSRKLIKPSSPTPYCLQTYKLSFFDQLAPRYYLPYVYFYTGHGDGICDNHLMTKINEKLEKSLSETLSLFYFLAGRLAEDGLKVNCNDEGVEYTRAHVKIQLDEYLSKGKEDADLMSHFVSWEVLEPFSGTTPLLCIQLTTFDCGGLALTFHASHMICDAFSCNTFMEAWATTSRQIGAANSVFLPNPSLRRFEFCSIFPGRKTLGFNTPRIRDCGAGILSKIFVFDSMALSKLKKEASTTLVQPSRVVAVTALIWRSLIRMKQAKHGPLRSSTVTVAVNLRGRTVIPTPANGFGNFVAPVLVKFKAGEETKMELQELVQLIKDARSDVEARLLKAIDADDMFSVLVNLKKEIKDEFCNRNVGGSTDFYICTSWCRFPFYELDFGWGKPCWVSGGNPELEMFILMDTKCGTGIEAKVSLNESGMEAFERDPDIVAFTRSSTNKKL